MSAPDDPALAATLAGQGAARILTLAADGPKAAPTVPVDLENALALARDQHFGLLEVQCLCLIGTAALIAGDHARAAAAAEAAIAAAIVHGWHDLPTAAAHAVQAQACLFRAEPDRALQAARRTADRSGRAGCRRPVRPAVRPRGRTVRPRRPTRRTLDLQEAQAELGATPVPAPVAASAAPLEHRAALLLDYPVAAATSLNRLAARGGHDGELTLMRAWSAAAAGAALEARATVAPLLDGSVRPGLPSTLVEAWLVEAWAALRLSNRPAARQALQAALGHAEPMDLLRPFAFAGQGMRALLVDQLGGARDPEAFAFRCLAARRRVSEGHPS